MKADQSPMTMNAAVAAQLRAERGAARMTVRALADASGIPEVSLNRLLSNERQITIERLELIASALGLTTEAVLGRARQRLAEADTEVRVDSAPAAMDEFEG